MYAFIYSTVKIFGVPVCTSHWFRPKGYNSKLDEVLNIMEFTEIIINQILVEITEYIMMYKLGKIGNCFLYF